MLAYDWNFLGLSLEAKPMTDEKVVDGSTFYECDTCDFYIFYQNKWYKQTFVTEDGINVYLYKSLIKKMFGKLFDGNITKSKIIKPDTGTTIEFTTTLPAQIIDLTGYGDTKQDGTPTPSEPVDIDVVTGEQTVTMTGKNLWKPAPDGTNIQGGITSVCENGVITLTGTSTSTSAQTSGFYNLDTPLPAGTYTYSVKNALPYRIEFVMQDSSGTNHFPRIEANSKSGTITTTWETVKIRNGISGYTSGTEINAVIEELQLEVGSTATEFQPYQSQSYTVDLGTTQLCKIGDYQDYIYKSGDNWYLHKVCEKYTFTGSENWVSIAYGTNSWNLSNLLNFPFDSNKLQIMSEVFRGIAAKDRGTAGNNLIYTASNVLFEIRNTTLTTLAGVQSATSGTPIYYALATPTDTKITDASLVTQLNALLKYTFPAGVNNITITADDLPMPLKLIISEKE